MAQIENIEAVERRLWKAADTLRSNSNYASNEYFLPVMGLIFLRHAYSRFLRVRDEIKESLPKRGGKTRALTKEDFSQKTAIFLQEEAQFDHLVSLTDSDDRAKAISKAMKSIEDDYQSLQGVLPRAEYQELDNEVLGQLLRILNPDELKKASGDVFGRIYEYFLTQFADLKAHDNGEFFTPVSLVSLLANVLEPTEGTVLDPACGSGGMFVQSAHFVERQKENPAEKLTFRGIEKNGTTIRLAKMNLAVHGLEGDIQKAITYYEDPHELLGKADYVMANPPFNVDEVDAEKVKRDPRLPFGLPGVNKEKKVSNGNYLWISYFLSYLSEQGRAGFVMSSQASSAGRDEAKVRQKLIESKSVDIMIAIRPNFFYTRTVPCELWFLDKDKPKQHQDTVLMIDARNIYRKVTRKIYDFSPEQLNNLLSIVWLYRGETERFLNLLKSYCNQTIEEAQQCFSFNGEKGGPTDLLEAFIKSVSKYYDVAKGTASDLSPELKELNTELSEALTLLESDIKNFSEALKDESKVWSKNKFTNGALNKAVERLGSLAEKSRDLVKQADLVFKLTGRVVDGVSQASASDNGDGVSSREIAKLRRAADEARHDAVNQLKQVRYFYRQAHWLVSRFPNAELQPVEGLVKAVSIEELEKNDWSLTPGRYVGVAPEEEDEDFDFEETLREIHVELEGLNGEAVELAARISKNFEELGI